MTSWPDAKRFLAESILVHVVMLALAFTWDFWFNLSIVTGLNRGEIHPVSIGAFQGLLIVYSFGMLGRYLSFWRYWR